MSSPTPVDVILNWRSGCRFGWCTISLKDLDEGLQHVGNP